ncbi:MAG TPA: SIR2 family protein [Thermoanaerobaculia bacterium]|nr:SIR2 family protein [Thermoanaerobaculia bacterium]
MNEPAHFPAKALGRLADRVVNGGVVFFIGSGFSIDSEGNSSRRLITRLLIRLLALADTLGRPEIVDDLRLTFGLKDAPSDSNLFRFTLAHVDALATRYYETNDWFCVAFGTLLRGLPPGTLDAVANREETIRLAAAGRDAKLRDDIPLDRIDPRLGEWALRESRAAGKALFLDTMGFRSERVMGGEPEESDPRKVLESYGGRLLPRHHIIARLAREGFCSITITANFDLLLEGAFRMSGFAMRFPNGGITETLSPPTYIDEFARIASPSEFFVLGTGHRSAVLVKMHGCAQHYKQLRDRGDDEAVAKYLPSMVFTYREIQNWRQDSWAADFLRTLMRTHTVVFCGYSLQDPVIHDTFRTVYEEMGRASGTTDAKKTEEDAPAFFLAPGEENEREFHGMEVLHAATRAFGTTPEHFNKHENYVRFHFRSDSRFPHVDEQLQWLEHKVFRIRQQQCLKAFLHRGVAGMFGKPRPDAEVQAVIDAFEAQMKREQERAEVQWTEAQGRREHAAVCAWTSQFHAGLLREFASIDVLHADRRPSRMMSLMRQLPWYYPTTASGGWVAWGAVVELALRNMAAALWNKTGAALDPMELRPAESLAPTLFFSEKPGETPTALTIRFCGFERHGAEPRIVGFPARKVLWELCRTDAPWPLQRAKDQRGDDPNMQRMSPPDAKTLWDAAIGTVTAAEARNYLGVAAK